MASCLFITILEIMSLCCAHLTQHMLTFYFSGDLEVGQVPQMVTLTFNGAVNIDNIRYRFFFPSDP